MHAFHLTFLVATLLSQIAANAMIFDTDDRLERHQLKDTSILSYSKSTAALMLKSQLDLVKADGKVVAYKIDLNKPGNGPIPDSGKCKRAFVGQPQLTGFCSTTLIGEDLLLTAGHCMERGEGIISKEEICAQSVAVFDYAYSTPDKMPLKFPAKNVYQCKKVEFFSNNSELDLALIRLDRPVKNREIFKLKKPESKSMEYGSTLYTSGYPRGMPNKTVLSGSFVQYHRDYTKRNTARFFADVMGGSSGSSVLDPITREIVGILISSDCNDTEYDKINECFYEPTFHYQCKGVEMTLMERTWDLIKAIK